MTGPAIAEPIATAGPHPIATTRRGTVALTLLAAAALGMLHFLVVLPPGILSGRHPVWTNPPGDVAFMLLGAEALLRGPWGLPLAQTPLLLAGGAPVSAVFTDSAPLIALLLKALGATPETISVPGVVLLLGFVLQPLAFALLLLALGVRRVEALLLGAALGMLMPSWLARMVGHLALSSHWLIPLALALAALAIRRGVTRGIVLGFAGLGVLAIGIHAYLWVCVAAIGMGALLADAARRPGLRTVLAGGGAILAMLAASAGAAALLGFTSAVGGAGGFGVYSMNLLSPWWPQYSGLVRLLGGGNTPLVDATGGGQWEGFNYFGAGLLLVLAMAAVGLLRRPPRPSAAALRAALPLAAALLGLTALAITGEVYLGRQKLLSLEPPAWLAPFLDQIRASGRLFWPMSYLLAALAIAGLARARRRGLAAVALLAAAFLQWVDVAPLREPLGSLFAAPAPYVLDSAPWRATDFSGAVVEFLPPGPCATGTTQMTAKSQVALIALRRQAILEGPPMARALGGSCTPLGAEALRTILEGEPGPPGRVRVLFTADRPDRRGREAASPGGACRAFEFGLVCGDAGRIAHFPIRPPEFLRFAQDERARAMLGSGWSVPEPWGVWSDGPRAELRVPLPAAWHGPVRLAAEALAFVPPGWAHQRVLLRAGDRELAEWHPGGTPARFEVTIPAEAIEEGHAVLTLLLPDAITPRQAGMPEGDRRLGIGLIGIALLGPG